ncbi:hypothetical protein PanWU01x14_284240 [Parasponia andersonii]|uniref:Uncharacterized protein n=1 Tax=Parasponia andersonii TaxID=3476 RepID=A0A2P5AZY1_PARAD|nr:hypothetical protein PanWU01x14_284240 [Parasponia andersonii]
MCLESKHFGLGNVVGGYQEGLYGIRGSENRPVESLFSFISLVDCITKGMEVFHLNLFLYAFLKATNITRDLIGMGFVKV